MPLALCKERNTVLDAENLVGFRKILPEQEPFDDVLSNEKVEDLLNNMWSGKSVRISFTPNERGDPIIDDLFTV